VKVELPMRTAPLEPTSDPSAGRFDEDLLIREAKRRHRKRLAAIGTSVIVLTGLVVGGVVALSSTPTATPSRHHAARTPSPSAAATPAVCSAGQLGTTVVFNQTGSDLGAIKLTDTSAHACSISGRPRVSVFDGAGKRLQLSEIAFARAGLPAGTPGPVVLPASGTAPSAIVELDWFWCGAAPGAISWQLQFPSWRSPLVIPYTALVPSGFSPAVPTGGCPGTDLFAVDDVRGFGPNGIATQPT
jgi:hypothetical protein